MDLILNNINNLKDIVQRGQYTDVSALDVLTAFHVLLKRPVDYAIIDDKNFTFVLETLSNVPSDIEARKLWLDTMFSTFEQMTNMNSQNANWSKWLLLKANVIFYAPVGSVVTRPQCYATTRITC